MLDGIKEFSDIHLQNVLAVLGVMPDPAFDSLSGLVRASAGQGTAAVLVHAAQNDGFKYIDGHVVDDLLPHGGNDDSSLFTADAVIDGSGRVFFVVEVGGKGQQFRHILFGILPFFRRVAL